MFAHVVLLVKLFKDDGSFSGYTDSEDNVYTGDRDEGFSIYDKFITDRSIGGQLLHQPGCMSLLFTQQAV